jgi:acetyl esterase/lipase
MPWAMRLHRALIYSQYESRALAFTRARWILQVAAGTPFRRMLAREVPDPALRARLTPAYPIGCKRILLSSDYLKTFSRPNVALVTESVARVTPEGIETADGKHYAADVIVYGTGFAATRFLAPMRIAGRGGLELNAAWAGGASSYLGMTVPGFPNFFMLYGPNTNLGHNSIIYMLESQFAHVLRALHAQRAASATEIEVRAAPHRVFNEGIQARLAKSAWVGCNSWYLDEKGRNTVNWPGFTLSYRWLAKHARLGAYQFTRRGAVPYETRVLQPPSRLERVFAAQNRLLLRAVFRPLVGPPLGLQAQRRVVDVLGVLMPAARKVRRERRMLGAVPVKLALPRKASPGAILYLHGGAFCLGSTWSHRGLTTRLARSAGMQVWTPDYRLAPEHPYPAALEDAVACYDALLGSGLRADQIVVAGDSAGAALAMALLLRLRLRQRDLPAGAALLSPGADLDVSDPGIAARAGVDPMLRPAWLRQAFGAYACPPDALEHRPLAVDLGGFPPVLIQVGSDEILLGDAQRLAAHAHACGVDCRLEVHEQRWHVFQLQGAQLATARAAIDTVAEFARERLAAHGGEGDAHIAARHLARDEKPVAAAP